MNIKRCKTCETTLDIYNSRFKRKKCSISGEYYYIRLDVCSSCFKSSYYKKDGSYHRIPADHPVICHRCNDIVTVSDMQYTAEQTIIKTCRVCRNKDYQRRRRNKSAEAEDLDVVLSKSQCIENMLKHGYSINDPRLKYEPVHANTLLFKKTKRGVI